MLEKNNVVILRLDMKINGIFINQCGSANIRFDTT